MRLSEKEFKAMNHPFRCFIQRNYEYPKFKSFGCNVRNMKVLEIGCGSGYGAALIKEGAPGKYTGVDLMTEQIEIAKKRNLGNCLFKVHDASNMDFITDNSMDIIFDFGILHHVPAWKRVLSECFRVLKPGGEMYLMEPGSSFLSIWEKIFKWGHPEDWNFSFSYFENTLEQKGFKIKKQSSIAFFKFYRIVKKEICDEE